MVAYSRRSNILGTSSSSIVYKNLALNYQFKYESSHEYMQSLYDSMIQTCRILTTLDPKNENIYGCILIFSLYTLYETQPKQTDSLVLNGTNKEEATLL